MVPAATTMPDFSGRVVEKRWQLLRMLGTGSYGVVYESVDLHPRTPIPAIYCAIKILRKAGRTPAQMYAMYEEIRLHGLVSKHPNIVTIHHAFEDDAYCFLVLSLCRGGDLFERICYKGLYTNNEALLRKAFLSLLDAVQECHEKNVYHRDLKPENIMTNEEGSNLYLADFGLATDRSIVYEHGCGTSVYMSPECIGRMTGFRPYCARASDIWALGVILVNMLSRQHPWAMATMDDCCFSRFVEDPAYFKKMLPITDGANAILLQLFALNPLQRISLGNLRKTILSLDAFFLPDDEQCENYEYTVGSFEYSSPSGDRVFHVCGCEAPVDETGVGNYADTIHTDSLKLTSARSTKAYILRPARFSIQDSQHYSDVDSDTWSASDGSTLSAISDLVAMPDTVVVGASMCEEENIRESYM